MSGRTAVAGVIAGFSLALGILVTAPATGSDLTSTTTIPMHASVSNVSRSEPASPAKPVTHPNKTTPPAAPSTTEPAPTETPSGGVTATSPTATSQPSSTTTPGATSTQQGATP